MARNPRLKDATGQRFGLWLVLRKAGNESRGGALWACRCDCGTQRNVRGTDLRKRKSVSCGCEKDLKTGDRSRTHGETGTRLHTIWKGMRARCQDSARKNYGARGISVCAEWDSFETFRNWALSNGYADHLTIERSDVNGHYTPGNCIWATAKVQSRNRRMVARAPDGTPWPAVAEAHGVSPRVYNWRVHAGGWDAHTAATWPLGMPRMARPRDSAGRWTA
jgi:hypothetical protein